MKFDEETRISFSQKLAMKKAKREKAERGKAAERMVEDLLERWKGTHLRFFYERLPDARAARGYIKAQLCDYLAWYRVDTERRSITLEVKQTEHDYRITKDHLDQLPRLRAVALAGAYGVVLVFHSTLNKWRAMPVSYFDGPIPASWDLRNVPTYDTAADALDTLQLFPPARI